MNSGPLSDMARNAALDEEIREHVDHVCSAQSAHHADREAFVRELIDHIEHPILLHHGCGVRQNRTTTHGCGAPAVAARNEPLVSQSQAALGLFGRNLQPDPLDALVIDHPTSCLPVVRSSSAILRYP